jgi:hypothetical protein
MYFLGGTLCIFLGLCFILYTRRKPAKDNDVFLLDLKGYLAGIFFIVGGLIIIKNAILAFCC